MHGTGQRAALRSIGHHELARAPPPAHSTVNNACLPAQTGRAAFFVEVGGGGLWCRAQGARVRRPRGARSWPAEARLGRGVASRLVATPASPARGGGTRPGAVVTRGGLVVFWCGKARRAGEVMAHRGDAVCCTPAAGSRGSQPYAGGMPGRGLS